VELLHNLPSKALPTNRTCNTHGCHVLDDEFAIVLSWFVELHDLVFASWNNLMAYRSCHTQLETAPCLLSLTCCRRVEWVDLASLLLRSGCNWCRATEMYMVTCISLLPRPWKASLQQAAVPMKPTNRLHWHSTKVYRYRIHDGIVQLYNEYDDHEIPSYLWNYPLINMWDESRSRSTGVLVMKRQTVSSD
jgi:hypothetical protein